jgi:pimeloyl-ACP methyl ester carboxylesterase
MKINIFFLVFSVFVISLKSNSQEVVDVQQEWTSYSQAINIADKTGYEFRVSAAIRKESKSNSSKAALWVRVDKKDGKVGFFNNNVNSINVTDKWEIFEIKGIIDANADLINIGAFVENTGNYYYDNFKLEIKKGNEKWELITIKNSGFEDNIEKEKFWKNGIGRKVVNVKDFEIEYSATNPYKGNKCLLIKGKNILGSNDAIGKYVDVNGVSLYYETYGEGEPLLMIHGNGNSMGGFIGNVPELAKHYKVVLVDCRGRGASTYNKNVELTFDLQIEDLKQFLDKLNIQKTNIIGWSDGGILGLLIAIKHPERVNKLVSMAANIFPDGCVDLDDMKKVRDDLIKDNKDNKNDLAIDLYNLDIKYPNLEYKDLGVIKSKTLIMAGDHDEIKNEHTVKIFEAIPGAQLAVVPNSTHYLPAQNPKLFNQIVLEFLK